MGEPEITSISLDLDTDYLVRVQVAPDDRTGLWDAGDYIRVRVGRKAARHPIFWVPRVLLLAEPTCFTRRIYA